MIIGIIINAAIFGALIVLGIYVATAPWREK
jgi:hypothetical protein